MRPVVFALALPLVAAVPHGHHDDALLSRRTLLAPRDLPAYIPPPRIDVSRRVRKDENGNDVEEVTTTKTTYSLKPSQPDGVAADAVRPAQFKKPKSKPKTSRIPKPTTAPISKPVQATPSAAAAPQPSSAQGERQAAAAAPGRSGTSAGGADRKTWVDDMLAALREKSNTTSPNGLYLSLVNQFRAFYNDGRDPLQLSGVATEAAEHWAKQCNYAHGDTTWKGVSLGQNIAHYPAADVAGAADPLKAAMLHCFHGWVHDEESLWDYGSKSVRADAPQLWQKAGFDLKPNPDLVIHLKNKLNRKYRSTGFAVQHCPSSNDGQMKDAYFCVANFELRDDVLSAEDELPAAKPGPFPEPAELAKAFLKAGESNGRGQEGAE